MRAARLVAALGLLGALFALPAAPASAAGHVDRTIKDGRITESSGLAASPQHAGVLWTHNDSGNPPRLYAIGKGGSTKATLTLRGEPNVDWEAIAGLRGPDGEALLAVGDIGDNNGVRSSVRIALVREPERLRTTSITPVRVLRLRYPDGPRDAEALLADPRNGRLYLVSKNLFGSDLYAVPKRVWPEQPAGAGRVSTVTTLTKVGSMSAGLITDGTFLPDGRMLLRGYGKMFVMARPEAVQNRRIATLADDGLPEQEQGESITVTDGGRQALIGSEGRRAEVLKVPVPAAAGDSVSGAGSGTGSGAAAATATRPPDPEADPGGTVAGTSDPKATSAQSDPSFAGVGNLRVWALVIGGAVVVIVLTLAALLLGNRNQRPRRR
jgi:hypothetical protein